MLYIFLVYLIYFFSINNKRKILWLFIRSGTSGREVVREERSKRRKVGKVPAVGKIEAGRKPRFVPI